MRTASQIAALARTVISEAAAEETLVAIAESCTGGMVAAALTAVPGSSAVLDRGFVTYSNEAKTEMLGVPAALIDKHGAVSEEVAAAMAEGAIKHSRASLAVAITGIAGPAGGGPDKPVGLVWFALALRGGATRTIRRVFTCSAAAGAARRRRIREEASALALQMLADAIDAADDALQR
jgi:nicotinamide-nucleotide amidase